MLPQRFSPDASIRLWWEAKARRPNQSKRKVYSCRKKSTDSSTSLLESEDAKSDDNELEDDVVLLDDWDQWMNPYDADVDDSDVD